MSVRLPSNRPPERFYRGGARITALRGEPVAGEREPEDWIASTTTVRGEAEQGLSRLPDGRLLRDAIEDDPVHWLGEEHVARWGSDIRLLVKLLDAGERLPVHAHPDDAFAAAHLGHAHGKAEAWYILEGGTVHIGLRREVSREQLAALVAAQDTAGLLELLHPLVVQPGDLVWVPPGELHTIGAGVLILELQQPEDLSILLEWRDFAIDGAALGHLGLGFERALSAVSSTVRASADELVSAGALPPEAARYFRLERHDVAGPITVDAGFAVLLVSDGELTLDGERAPRGTVILRAAADGPLAVTGAGALLVARPPAPSIDSGA